MAAAAAAEKYLLSLYIYCENKNGGDMKDKISGEKRKACGKIMYMIDV